MCPGELDADAFGVGSPSMPLQELWNAIPERSKLYSLAPIQIATPDVESLTDYVKRLAQAHSVSVRYLLSNEIYYSDSEGSLVKWSNWMAQASSINGLGPEPPRFLEVVQNKTRRDDLSGLTLLRYKGVFCQKQLLRPYRAWCSSCLEGMRTSKSTIYEKLVWAIDCVACCPLHNRLLDNTCLQCLKRQSILAANSVPGRCDRCMAWLGAQNTQTGHGPSEYELWLAKAVGQIAAASPLISAERVIANYREGVMWRAREIAGGSVRALSRIGGDHSQLLNRLANGGAVQIGALLRSAFELELPIEFLLRNRCSVGPESTSELSPSSSRVVLDKPNCRVSIRREVLEREISRPAPRPPRELAAQMGYHGTAQLWRADNTLYARLVEQSKKAGGDPQRKVPSRGAREVVKRALDDALCQANPPSVKAIAVELGYRSETLLRRWFQADCIAITEKRTRLKVARVTSELKLALEQNPPPPLEWAAKNSGYSVAVLTRVAPELRDQLQASRQTYLGEQKDKVRESVLPFLDESPPPTGAEIASRLGMSFLQLRSCVPDLWQKLRERNQSYRAKKKEEQRESLFDQVRRVVDRLISAGEYPSASRVAAEIGEKCCDWKLIGAARREALNTLEGQVKPAAKVNAPTGRKKADGAA